VRIRLPPPASRSCSRTGFGTLAGRHLAVVTLALVAGLGRITPLPAQQDPQEEARLLRAAASRESRGDLDGAEAVLRQLLEQYPTSSGGVFALERVLRARGRVAEVLPVVDIYLDREPASPGPRYLKLRVLVELDSLEAVDEAAEAWIRADPESPDPYKEVARIYERAFGPEDALAVLRRGQEELGDSAALAVETGDLLLRLGQEDAAVEEWSRAIGSDGAQAAAILRRVGELEGDRAALVKPLVDALGSEPTTTARRRAAAHIAVEAGLEDEAVEQGGRAAAALSARSRRSFLTDLARRADEAGSSRVSLWAYQSLRDAAEGPEARALDERIVTAALAAGDTALARRAQDRVATALPRGSPERRRALAMSIRLGAAEEGVARIRQRVSDFRSEFPGAPELDELAANLAWDLQVRGRLDEAAAVIEGVDGPRSSMERGYIHFALGDLEAGREALLESVDGLPASSATDVIELAAVLQRVAPETAPAVAAAAAQAHRGDGPQAVQSLMDASGEAPTRDRPALLVLAARYADEAGRNQDAAELRARLISEFPEDPGVPEATIELARFRAEQPDGLEEAVRLLEDLILLRPNSPVVPHARRELQRLQGRIPTEREL
jgi:tetratricopeptide (TPR) repeat protein